MDQKTVDISGARVAISLPCYKGVVPVDWVVSFARTQSALAAHGVRSWLQSRLNSGLIHAVRNELVHTFLQDTESTHILFVDDDIVWSPDDVLRLLAWTKTGLDFVCGVYPARMDEPTYFVDLAKDAEGRLIQNEQGLLLAKGVPSGFMLCSRAVFESPALRAQCPVTKPTRGDLKDELLLGFFDHMHEGLTSMGEDIAFCRRHTRAGGQIWIDPTINLSHIGTKAYRHPFPDWIRAQAVG